MSRVNSSSSMKNGVPSAAASSSNTRSAPPADYLDQQRERSPEPDEDFRMEEQETAWLVKVPRFLYDGWSNLTQDDLNLGKVRVYDADSKGHQRIELILPSAPEAPIPLPEYDPASAGRDVKRIPRNYDLKLTSEAQQTAKKNIFAFREKHEGDDEEELDDDEDISSASVSSRPSWRRKRAKITTAFAGKITNEAAVKPILASMSEASSRGVSPSILASSAATGAGATDSKTGLGLSGTPSNRAASFTPEYREILRRRKLESTKPKRTVKMLDDADDGAHNMLMAGLGQGHMKNKSASSFIVQNPKPTASSAQKEKFTRLPKNELLDFLFNCYERYTYWTIKALRDETHQPESYLRETLSSIADQHKRGPYMGQWSLKNEYVQQRKQEEEQRAREGLASGGGLGNVVKAEGEGEDDEEMEDVI
ncbi:hypothetical protein BCV69DRAFT_277372 [Microstroma glucosiphilum]|uniref:Transcription initiation factor IIF subunit beta n=1 Tax=Pseudomicrostroma glucosiphilum TaxID=1684307 RepID=A0A316U5Y7_9BASI|nr:hypothetical protein BCV69DRAFT_277372 [Pseudomicrostroma glucosiphilum]PWN20677.1 hypothetical protein BCV69DRAFT_277372 [Pseudomicrostroma glucosiphilum]